MLYYLLDNVQVIWTWPYQKEEWCVCVTYDEANEEQKIIIDTYNTIEERELFVTQYKNIQKNIADVKLEIQEINDTYDTYTDEMKVIADQQLIILNNKLVKLRKEKDELVLSAVNEYWVEVLNEL